jgi:hypothetical protein
MTAFEDIDTYEPLPSEPAEGFGIATKELDTVKAADIVDQPIAVIGYIIMDNQFKKEDNDPDKVVLFECMDAAGDTFGFWHTSGVLRKHVVKRHQREEIPFRTVLVKRPPKKDNGNPYYDFA